MVEIFIGGIVVAVCLFPQLEIMAYVKVFGVPPVAQLFPYFLFRPGPGLVQNRKIG
jgi:MFS superfamily sulfate permease-like transporter